MYWERMADAMKDTGDWPADYFNRDTGKRYTPHHDGERQFVFADGPWRYGLAKGGEGGGKSVAGIIKCLERVRRGMSGIMVSPDLPHFAKSLWPEFANWCPWDVVVRQQQKRKHPEWEPYKSSFSLSFKNGAKIYCGGIENPRSWEGANINFAFFDEARRHRDAGALKVLDGRVRIPGYNMNGSILTDQLWITTTPEMHWLYDYFGPLKCMCDYCQNEFELDAGEKAICLQCRRETYSVIDEWRDFKSQSLVITLLTKDNAENLSENFDRNRRQTLTETEALVYLDAQWIALDTAERFLPSILLWDACKDEDLPPLTKHEPMVIALDAGVSDDNFALVGLTLHPENQNMVAVRVAERWEPPKAGEETGLEGKIDFQGTEEKPGPERRLRWLCENYNVVLVVYDAMQLHDMATRLTKEEVAVFEDFPQGKKRAESDRGLKNTIVNRQLAHDGTMNLLRQHVDNSDQIVKGEALRIVKRSKIKKIDMTICLSMANHVIWSLNLTAWKKVKFMHV